MRQPPPGCAFTLWPRAEPSPQDMQSPAVQHKGLPFGSCAPKSRSFLAEGRSVSDSLPGWRQPRDGIANGQGKE
jgi:hypothetical protein